MDICFWKECKQKNANEKIMELYNRNQRRVCTKKRESIFIVEGREVGGAWIHPRTIEKRIYQALEVATNSTSVFCGEEG